MRPSISSATLALIALGFAALAHPQSPPTPEKRCQDPVFHQFDFWLGDWDVSTPEGELAGHNSISREEYGCLLVEHWTSANGVTGQSYNFVDRVTGRWRQIWVSAGATIDYQGGLDDRGRMRLEGTIGYPPDNPANGARFRGTWTANDDGSVRQHFEQFDAAKGEWTDWFVGIYRKRDPSSAPR
ncbi:MAG: hypothetical protein R3E77_15320 [Steroidobacteraceae bacterium]